MQSKWQKTTLGEFVNINPRRSVKKGTVTPFVGMPDITENIRDIRVIGEREFGSGMKFQDGDTLFARITPCLENGKTVLVNGLGEGVIAHGSTEFIVLSPKDISMMQSLFITLRDYLNFESLLDLAWKVHLADSELMPLP